MSDVEHFATEAGLQDRVHVLKKGALVAQDPANYENLDLDEDEKAALRMEVTRKWKHPSLLYVTIVICSIGAAVQGWDQTGSNGANLSFPQEFGIGAGEEPAGPDNPNHDRDNWLVGLVNAGPYIGSAFLGCWLSDPINYYIGRRVSNILQSVECLLTLIGYHLRVCYLSDHYANRWRRFADLGTAFHYTFAYGNWYGSQGFVCAYICC